MTRPLTLNENEGAVMAKWTSITLAGLLLAVLLTIGVCIIALIRFAKSPAVAEAGVHGFAVNGVVVDAVTGATIPDAHVIIVVLPRGMDKSSQCFGVIADANGRFAAKFVSQQVLEPFLSVVASTPQDGYAEKGVRTPSIVKKIMTVTGARLETTPLTPDQTSKPRYRYTSFSVGCVGDAKVHFLNGGW
jgi:hypothetical protein